jgi:hypothetical protein
VPSLTSAQVPNVKLRPAQQRLTPRPSNEDCWAQETQLGSDDAILVDRCPRPFKGLVICATGIPDKVRQHDSYPAYGLTIFQAHTVQASCRTRCNTDARVYGSCNAPCCRRSWRAQVQCAVSTSSCKTDFAHCILVRRGTQSTYREAHLDYRELSGLA